MSPLTAAQRALVEDHAHLVDWAARVARHPLGHLSIADRRSLADEALVALALSYRGGRGFERYVGQLIVWRMVDLHRQETRWRPQLRRGRIVEVPLEGLVHDNGHEEEDHVLAVDEPGYDRIVDAARAAATIEALALSDRERTVLTLISEGLTLKAIGDRLGVTEARVCQIRCRVRARLQHLAVERLPDPRPCAHCGRLFVSSGRRGRPRLYCGDRCRHASVRARKLARRAAA